MVDVPDSPEPTLGSKGPAPVTSSTTSRRTRSAVKKAAVKRPVAKKKAVAKKTVAKKTVAKKAPAKKAPAAKKASVAKTAPAVKKAPAAKKVTAKKLPAKKVTAKKPPIKKVTADTVPPAAPATPAAPPIPMATPAAALRVAPERFAIQASVTQGMLNDLVLFVVGAGIALPPLEKAVTLPAMGEVNVRLALTITGAQVDLRAADAGRVRMVVTADGDVSTVAEDYDGDVVDAGIGTVTPAPGPMGFPVPPAPIPVRVEALVVPSIELRADHSVSLGLDLRSAELISVTTDAASPAPAGVDPAAWSGILAMFGMLLGSMGQGLFESLGEHVGTVGTELDPQVGSILAELGVAVGHGHVSVSDELVSIGLVADPSVVGRAIPVPIAGKRVGLAMASSVVDALAHKLVLQAVGDLPLPLPFELDVALGEQAVSGRLRNARVLPANFPDLRSSLRTQVRTRLLRGQLELTVQAAWVELPSALPSIFNRVSKRLGELVSLAPIRVRFPARIGLPIIPDSTDTIPVEVDDLRVTTEGVGIVVSLA